MTPIQLATQTKFTIRPHHLDQQTRRPAKLPTTSAQHVVPQLRSLDCRRTEIRRPAMAAPCWWLALAYGLEDGVIDGDYEWVMRPELVETLHR